MCKLYIKKELVNLIKKTIKIKDTNPTRYQNK